MKMSRIFVLVARTCFLPDDDDGGGGGGIVARLNQIDTLYRDKSYTHVQFEVRLVEFTHSLQVCVREGKETREMTKRQSQNLINSDWLC